MTVPRIETQRLVLREWRPSDLDAYAGMCADPQVMRFLGGTIDRAESWRRMAIQAGHWQLRGYGNWVIDRAGGDGRMIGRAGLWYPEGWFGLELGWMRDRAAWGQGYGGEAAGAAAGWAWRHLDIARLISVIDPDNQRSLALAARLGMAPLREEEAHGRRVVIMEARRPGRPCATPAAGGSG